VKFAQDRIDQNQLPTENKHEPGSNGTWDGHRNRIESDLCYTVRSSGARLIRLDTLSDAELEDRCRFPGSAEEALSDNIPNIPVSAEPELFTPQAIREFITLVNTEVGEIDLGFYLVEQDITRTPLTDSPFSDERTFRNQALHSVTAFSYNGKLMGGPFCGSAAKYVLMHCKRELLEPDLMPATRALLQPLIDSFSSFTVAFPDRQIFTPQSDATTDHVFDLSRSPTFQLLCGNPINSTVFKPAVAAGQISSSASDHLYYYSGPQENLFDPKFTTILHAIRAARDKVAAPVRATPEFKVALAKREEIAREYIRRLILPLE